LINKTVTCLFVIIIHRFAFHYHGETPNDAERGRQTDRQTDRQGEDEGRKRVRERDRQTDREKEGESQQHVLTKAVAAKKTRVCLIRK